MSTEQEKQFIAAWRFAEPELKRIRDAELRSLDDESTMRQLGAGRSLRQEVNGLGIFQAWMMRLRVLQLLQKTTDKS